MPFWDSHHFDLSDPINAEIWENSPQLQHAIQTPAALAPVGAFGAQQAMFEAPHQAFWDNLQPSGILPWVPDLVGKRWKKKDAVFVVGSAYAGFIDEYSGRDAAMNLCCYASANSASAFQERFLKNVVRPDQAYYSRLATLFDGIRTMDALCVMDLCRASFVLRGLRDGLPGNWDQGGDAVVKDSAAGPPPHIFQQYVDQNSNWTLKRFMQSKASKIVALGSIAEHGVLRLFQNYGFTIQEQGFVLQPPVPANGNAAWVNNYAEQGRKLGYWLQHSTWWSIISPDAGHRTFHLLPIYHPSKSNRYDPNYQQTRMLLPGFFAA